MLLDSNAVLPLTGRNRDVVGSLFAFEIAICPQFTGASCPQSTVSSSTRRKRVE